MSDAQHSAVPSDPVPGPPAAGGREKSGRHPWVLSITTLSVIALWVVTSVALNRFPTLHGCIVRVELAGTADTYAAVLHSCHATNDSVRHSVIYDYGFIAIYGVSFATMCIVGARLLFAGRTGALMRASAAAVGAAVVFDALENAALLRAVPQGTAIPTADGAFVVATALSIAKFVALLPVLLCAVLVTATLAGRFVGYWIGRPATFARRWIARWLTHGWRHVPPAVVKTRAGAVAQVSRILPEQMRASVKAMAPTAKTGESSASSNSSEAAHRPGQPQEHVYDDDPQEWSRRSRERYIAVHNPAPPDDPSGAVSAWSDGYRVPESQRPGEFDERLGICLSGGGIRAGTFALGALQAFAAGHVLERARLMASVSGGGYVASAYQTLRAVANDPTLLHESSADRDPLSTSQAFAAGSPEEDHVRRHGEYIADGPGQWVTAVFVLVRNSALGIGLFYAVVVLAALPIAGLYVRPTEWGLELIPSDFSSPQPGRWLWVSLGLLLGLAFLAWLVSGAVTYRRLRQSLSVVAVLTIALAAGVAVVSIGIPWLVHGVVRLTNQQSASNPAGTAAAATAVTAIVAAGTTLINILSPPKGEGKASPISAIGASVWSRIRSTAAFVLRFLLTFLVLVGLVALVLLALGAEISRDVRDLRTSEPSLLGPALALAFLVLMAAFFDQTRMSLHPFYKQRLASAFYLRRKGAGQAAAIDDRFRSTLSLFGLPLRSDGSAQDLLKHPGMQLLLCAAAHASGQTLTPPGRRVVPFVFSWDYCGSPDLGYFGTKDLERAVRGKAYRNDVTLLAAGAISGAAIASAMGRASGPFDRLLAVSNARLGAWLPNPRYHDLMQRDPASMPLLETERHPLPWIRRLPYYALEVANVYPTQDRFLYVTDGGHYENLGLVELLRRQCSTILCVDASGDHSIATTLAEAASLAFEELGVVVSIDGLDLSTFSAQAGRETNQDLLDLHRRLSAKAVLQGSIQYPALGGERARTGVLIVGKAVLGQDLRKEPEMFQLKTYAVGQPEFPGDTTADQWFDVGRFQGYLTLGRLVGRKMCALVPPPP